MLSSVNVCAVLAILRVRACFKDKRILYILCQIWIKFGTGDGHGCLLTDFEFLDERPSQSHTSVTGVNGSPSVQLVLLDDICTQRC